MDIRERGVSPENADKLSLRAVDPSVDITLDLNRPGERRIFMNTLSKDLISYMANLQYCKITYKNRLNSSRGFMAFSSYFYNECRRQSTRLLRLLRSGHAVHDLHQE